MPSTRFYIPKSKHGIVIGKGASTLKELQTKYNVQIRMPNRDDTSCAVEIMAQSDDSIARLKHALEQLLGFTVSTVPLVSATLNVPSNKHGAIIGKGGSNLRELERKFGCVISLPDRDSGSSEVGVEGNDRAVDELANELSKLLNISVNAKKKQSAAPTKVSLDGRIEEAFFFPEPQDSDTQFSHFLSFLRAPTKTLDIAVYTLSDMSIAQAIIDQHLAGVRVRIITDNDTSKSPGSLVQLVEEKGVAIMLDQSRFHMHHKFALLDSKVVMAGSLNYSRQARMSNSENVIITSNAGLVKQFTDKFELMWKDSKSFKRMD